jgi:hypothetical protein
VFGAQVDALNHDPVFIRQDIDDLAALFLIFQATADDYNCIAFTNLDFHTLTPTLA